MTSGSNLLDVLLLVGRGWVMIVVVCIQTNTPLDLNEALLLARGHPRRAKDLIHLFEREALSLWAEKPDE